MNVTDRVAETLRQHFESVSTHVTLAGHAAYCIHLGNDRTVWCLKTCVRNHLKLLTSIATSPCAGIREYHRHGYIVAVDISNKNGPIEQVSIFQ